AAGELVEKVKAQRAAVMVRMNVELTAAYRRLSGSRMEIEVLRDEVLPSADTAWKQSEEGYQGGLFGYLEVLDAQRTLNRARLQLIQAFSDYRGALAQIEGLIGATGADTKPSE
ncbi:MAG: TolC family protein, partial [Pirellulaceae bacterium]